MSALKTRQQAETEFWSNVEGILTRQQLTKDPAQSVSRFKNRIKDIKVEGVIYNGGEEQAATIIANLEQNGHPQLP